MLFTFCFSSFCDFDFIMIACIFVDLLFIFEQLVCGAEF